MADNEEMDMAVEQSHQLPGDALLQQPANQQPLQLQQFLAGIAQLSNEDRAQLLGALQPAPVPEMTPEERAEKEARYFALRAEEQDLAEELGINVADAGVSDEAQHDDVGSPSVTNAQNVIALLAEALKQVTSQPVRNTDTHSNNHNAKGLKPPTSYQQGGNEVRRPDIFLHEIEEHAAAHNNKPEHVLPTYLEPALKAVYLDYMKAWEAKNGRKPGWVDVRSVFMNIVGHHAEHDKARVEDDLTQNRIQQRRDQSLLTYKIHFQHKLLLVGNVPDNLAVCHFLGGLGCKLLRAECQPDWLAGRMPSVDVAYDIARGKERMLSERGTIKPFGSDLNVQAGTSTERATLGAVRGGSRRGHATDASGRPICDYCGQARSEPDDGCRNYGFHQQYLNGRGTRGGHNGGSRGGQHNNNHRNHDSGDKPRGNMPAGQGVSKPARRGAYRGGRGWGRRNNW